MAPSLVFDAAVGQVPDVGGDDVAGVMHCSWLADGSNKSCCRAPPGEQLPPHVLAAVGVEPLDDKKPELRVAVVDEGENQQAHPQQLQVSLGRGSRRSQ